MKEDFTHKDSQEAYIPSEIAKEVAKQLDEVAAKNKEQKAKLKKVIAEIVANKPYEKDFDKNDVQDAADMIDKKIAEEITAAWKKHYIDNVFDSLADNIAALGKKDYPCIPEIEIVDAIKLSELEESDEAKKYPGRHYTDLGFKAPVHGFYNANKAKSCGYATWITAGGQMLSITSVRPGESISVHGEEKYVGDVIACLVSISENKQAAKIKKVAMIAKLSNHNFLPPSFFLSK